MKIEELNNLLRDVLRDNIPNPTGETYNWIWYGYPLTKVRYPSISIFQSASVPFSVGIGHSEHGQRVLYEITVVTNRTTEAIINNERYAGYRLCAYLVSEIARVLKEKREALREQGIEEVEVTRITSVGYDPEREEYISTVFVELTAILD